MDQQAFESSDYRQNPFDLTFEEYTDLKVLVGERLSICLDETN